MDELVCVVPSTFCCAISDKESMTSMISVLALSNFFVRVSIWRIRSIDASISPITPFTICSVLSICIFCFSMISCVLPIVSTTRWEFPISVFTISPILPLAVSDCSASFCISDATTAKPFPASPARAASMLAFKERRFVWDAISEINCDAF